MYTVSNSKANLSKQSYGCPVEVIIELIGGKWKVVILYYLHRDGTLRFSQIKRRTTGITQKMLAGQLRKLEADGFIKRKVYPVVPPHVEYSLTPLGESLLPILEAMRAWADTYAKH